MLISADKERQRSRTHSTSPTGTSALGPARCVPLCRQRIPSHTSAAITHRVPTLHTGPGRSQPCGSRPRRVHEGQRGREAAPGKARSRPSRRGARLPSIHAPSARSRRAVRVPPEPPPGPGPRPRLPALSRAGGRQQRSGAAGPGRPWRPRLQPPASKAAPRHPLRTKRPGAPCGGASFRPALCCRGARWDR